MSSKVSQRGISERRATACRLLIDMGWQDALAFTPAERVLEARAVTQLHQRDCWDRNRLDRQVLVPCLVPANTCGLR